MKKFVRTVWRCAYPVAIYFALEYFVQILFLLLSGAMGGKGAAEDLFGRNALVMTAISAVLSAPFLLCFFFSDNFSEREYEAARPAPVSPLSVLIGIGGAVGIGFLVSMLLSVSGLPEKDPSFGEVNELISGSALAIQIAAACVAAPAAEELLFRGVVFRRIRASYGATAAVICSSVGFGLFHGNLTQGIYAAVLGVVLAVSYEKTNALFVPVLMHAFANLANLMLTETAAGQRLADTDIGAAVIFGVSLFFTVVWIIWFRNKESAFPDRNAGKEMNGNETFKHRDSLL